MKFSPFFVEVSGLILGCPLKHPLHAAHQSN